MKPSTQTLEYFLIVVRSPFYFAGDIRHPANKIVFIGINPGFDRDFYPGELRFLEARGLFEGYWHLFDGFFKAQGKSVPYYSKIGGFLRGLFALDAKIDWDWFQKHLITLDFIPYHSVNAKGLRINNPTKFRRVYFQILLKLLSHLNSQWPIFINGFPTFSKLVSDKQGVRTEYQDVLKVDEQRTIAIGTIGGDKQWRFVGLPFLSQQTVGRQFLVAEIRRRFGDLTWTSEALNAAS